MNLDKSSSSEDSEDETPFSEVSETDSQYLKRRTLQKRHRNTPPGSGANSPNKKKNKSAKPKQLAEQNKSKKSTEHSKSTKTKQSAEQNISPPQTRSKSITIASEPTAPTTTNTNNPVSVNKISSKIPEPQEFSEPEPPPIFISKIDNFVTFGQEIAGLIGQTNFRCFSRVNDIKINTNSRENYKTLINYFTSKNYDFHCYQLRQEKPYRVVLRGLHSSTPISFIKSGLEEIGHNVRHISCVLHPTEKYPLPLFFVDLEPASNNIEIFQVKRLIYSTIKFEEPRQKPIIVQCTKCQDLGHTKTYCHHQARCVKCAGPHASDTCQRPRDLPAKCALCGEEHPANYRGCKVYKHFYKQRAQNIASKSVKLNQESVTHLPEIDNLSNFPELPKTSTQNTQLATTSKEIDQPQQDFRKTPITMKKQQPQIQAPQISQCKPQSHNPQSHPPRQQILPHHIPLRVKLPPQHPQQSHPNAQKKSAAQVPSNLDPPRAQRRIPPSANIPNPPQEPILNPIHNQHPSDITSILSSFLLDLQNTIKPLITLLTRILTEIPFNFPR